MKVRNCQINFNFVWFLFKRFTKRLKTALVNCFNRQFILPEQAI